MKLRHLGGRTVDGPFQLSENDLQLLHFVVNVLVICKRVAQPLKRLSTSRMNKLWQGGAAYLRLTAERFVGHCAPHHLLFGYLYWLPSVVSVC